MDGDLVLLDRWRTGDLRAGDTLFQRHFADVLRFFENKCWSKAEDLTQQTFMECVRARDRFRGDSSFRTYLFAIAWNQLRQHFRREASNDNIDFEVSSISDLVAEHTSPSSNLDRARQGKRLQQALTQLPLAQQALLECHYWHDLDAAALSEIFGIPAGTVRVRLLRARNALRAELDRMARAGTFPADAADDALSTSLSQLDAGDKGFDATDREERS